MALTAKQRSTSRAHEDAHGAPINYRHVKNVGVQSVRGGNPLTDGNGDELAMTLVADCDQTFAVPAAGSVYTAGAVWAARAVVTTAGTTAMTLYDNAGPQGSAAGTPLTTIPASATAGSVWQIQLPVKAGGISAVGAAGTPAITVGYA